MRKIFLFAFALLTTHLNYAQFVVFNDNTVGTNQNQNIRTAANTGAPIQDLVPIGGRVVAISQVTGGTHSGGNQWYLIDYPNNSGASTQGYMAAGIPLSLPECNRSYFTVTNSNGSSNIRTDHTLSAANIQLSGTSLVGWTGQKFALVSTNYIDQDNYRWYNIYLTVNSSTTTGWIAGYSIGSGATLGTVTSSNYNGVLTAPILSSATNVGNNGADISWTTSNIDYYFKRYEIYLNGTMAYSQNQLNYDGLSNSINKTLSGLSSNTAYSCYVIAYNASGCNSAHSNTINFTTTGGCPSQAAPTASSATSTQQTSFQANWSAASGASGYRIDVSTNSSFSSFVSGYNNLDVSNVLLKSVTGLACNTTYYYRVWAYNSCGNTSASPSSSITVATATCPCGAQTAPAASAATNTQQTSFQANWSAASGASGYRIDVSTNSSFSSFVSGYNNLDVNNVLLKSVTGLACNTTYYYRVWAYNSCGNTSASPSSTITVTTTTCPCGSQSAPIASSATSTQQTSFQANWSAPSGASGYKIDVSTNSSFSSFVSGYNNLDVNNVLLKSVTGLACNTTYYYRVWAYNSCGNTSASPSSTITVTTSICATCPSPQTAIGLPTLLYPLQADASDYGTWGSYSWNSSWAWGTCAGLNKRHNGLDLHFQQPNTTAGTNVLAAYDGIVKKVYTAGANWAQGVVIEHTFNGTTFTTTYIHVVPDAHFVNDGDYNFPVHQGDVIGTVAYISGPHLHFNIRIGSYELIAIRGALPKIEDNINIGDCKCNDLAVPNQHNDFLFPEKFIDPALANYFYSGRSGQNFTIQAIKSKLSGASVLLKRNGWNDYYSTGFTDENGIANLKFSSPLNLGDSLKIKASNAATNIFAITQEMIANNKIEVPFIQEVNVGKIAHPVVKIQLDNPVTIQPNFQLKITADNLSQYQIGRAIDDSIAYTTFLPQDSIITLTVQDTGRSYIYVSLMSSLDTLRYVKYIDYTPVLDSTYEVFLNTNLTSENAYLYVDGQSILKLQAGTNSLRLSNSVHKFRLIKQNFIDTVFDVSGTTAITLSLNPLSVVSPSDSVVFSINDNTPHYWERGITVKRSNSNNTSISIKGYYDSYSPLSLLPVSNTYFLRNLTTTNINLEIAALTKQNIIEPIDNVYLLLTNNGSITKDTLTSNEYDSENGKFALSVSLDQKMQLAIIKKQAAIVHSISTQSMFENDSLIIPVSQIFSDPDSIPNDMTFTIINDHPVGLHLNFSGSNVNIYSMIGYVGPTTVIISAQHDYLTVYDTININIVSRTGIKEIKSISDVQLYPNPSNGDFILSFNTSKSENVQVKIFNLQGQQLVEEKPVKVNGLYKREIKLNGILPKGVYLLELKVGQQSITKQIVFE